MKNILFLVLILAISPLSIFAQIEKYPIYQGCNSDQVESLELCFLDKVSNDFYSKFIIPDDVTEEQKHFYVVFVASKLGDFEVILVSSTCTRINKEVERIFSELPKFDPATFNGHPIDKQFILYYPDKHGKTIQIEPTSNIDLKLNSSTNSYQSKISRSSLRVSLSNSIYRNIESNSLLQNSHTTIKPFLYQLTIDAEKFDENYTALLKNKSSWWGRKLWNENFVEVAGENYWFHINPIADLQLGKDNSDFDYTYNNTRAIKIEGELFDKFGFSSSLFESQGRFVSYFNNYAFKIKPYIDGASIVPGQGVAKNFGENAHDYPVAMGYLSYSPNKTFNFQFGRDKNFIGEGYRSMFLSDNATASTFFKIQTNFWKIQYTNLWLWLRDVREEVYDNNVYRRKFAAIHHLSWNVTKKLNIGLFESVIWAKTADQGFDVDYLNPIILFKPIEFAMGSNSGNVLLGLNAKYKFTDDINVYSQILFDEITLNEITGSEGYWGNKYAFQIGAKYHNAFDIKGLSFQTEYNMARPYTYSHDLIASNYGHFNQSLAHPWGSNFREGLFIVDYQKKRWFGMGKIVTGIKGFDYNNSTDSFSYGGDIYRDFNDRNAPYGIETGQGNKANIFIGEFQTGYLINPATNLKLFGSVIYRKFNAPVENQIFKNEQSTWFTFGLRSDLSNWYFDF